MEVAYIYTKARSEFGKHCQFEDGETQVIESILPTDEYDSNYVQRNPCTKSVSTVPQVSETEVNTERVVTTNSGMHHVEGGWPKDVDPTELSDVARYRKKAEKDEDFQYAMKTLGPIVSRCMKQNNTVNIYQEYFAEEKDKQTNHCPEPPSAKGVAVFRDPSTVRRTATSIDWHPEGGRIAVSYSILNFQDDRLGDPSLSSSSYIWDITNSNTPLVELVSPSPLTCLRFNPKSSDTLVGGCHNGLIVYFDLRKQSAPAGQCKPIATSVIESSHHDPVRDVFWVQSKTGHHCASVSTDGQLLWWDTRNLEAPTDAIILPKAGEDGRDLTLGGSSLEYNTDAGATKYLIGTEQGIPLSINLRQRKNNNGITVLEGSNGTGKHHGSVHAIQRNPVHTKFFMTVGDWTAKVWSEDIKTPIVSTRYHDAYATSGCWSPTRPGVFYVTRVDGFVDIWDLYHSHGEVAYSHKVSDAALSAVSIQGNPQKGGKLVAVGDVNGTVSLLEVCDSLSKLQQNEKASVGNMFEREARREKSVEIREREEKRSKAVETSRLSKERELLQFDKEEKQDLLLKAEEQFYAMIREAEAKEEAKVSES
eukprot:CAMPEP_0178723246 /NCGR_PEP_ID=MMETSP0699-20121125/25442_1 /TAXON_ID=265572 /ORGANISM="Extubocellulus spinifer, Strain CCMP396" /LENGTH=590 /DNA_ID=CAMNT_0020374309 /DNA_START=76 /DNA_END=1848 /DNA_ORIENTATION=-